MKQRVRVVGMVREGDSILLLRRSRGRAEEAPSWELPTGKVQFGEQPEEALSRMFFEELGAQVGEMKLSDAITFVGVPGASQLLNLYIIYDVKLDGEVNLQLLNRYSEYRFVSPGEMKELKLDEATVAVLNIESGRGVVRSATQESDVVNNNETEVVRSATIHFDGASRGNPGPSGVGYVVLGEDGEVIKQGGEFIGFATSRVAEYYALKEACEQALELGVTRVRFVGDSLMVINQMNGVYRVKNHDLMQIHDDVLKLLSKFEQVAFLHVKRDQNREADAQANRVIDEHFGKKNRGGQASPEVF